MKWLIIVAVLLVGCEKKTEPAKGFDPGSGSGSAAGSAVGLGSGSSAVGATGSAAPVVEAMRDDGRGTAMDPSLSAAGTCDDAACALGVMKGFRDQICKCADDACAMRVTQAMTAWAQDAAKTLKDVKPDEAMMKEMEQVGRAIGDCASKAMMAGKDPAAGGDLPLPPSAGGFHKQRTTPIGKPPAKKPACMEAGTASADCAIESMTYFTDLMCACPDKTCGEALIPEMTKWAQEISKTAENTKPTAADLTKMEAIGKRLGECSGDVMLTDPTAP